MGTPYPVPEGCIFFAFMVLKEAVNDQYDYISWCLYGTDDYLVETSDGSQKWDLRERPV